MEKKFFYNLHSDICKSLSNPGRQAVFDTIRYRSLTVSQIVKKTGLPQSNISQHLALLKTKGIVCGSRKGCRIFYSIANHKIIEAYDLITESIRDESNLKAEIIDRVIGKKHKEGPIEK